MAATKRKEKNVNDVEVDDDKIKDGGGSGGGGGVVLGGQRQEEEGGKSTGPGQGVLLVGKASQ